MMQRWILMCWLLPVALCACSSTTATGAADTADDAVLADVGATDAVGDAGADALADVAADVPVDVAADVSPLGPATWTGIYADYFGPTGTAACAGAGCHTSVDQPGYIVSNFICPDKDTCYTSLVGKSKMVLPTDYVNPTKSKLMRNLRQAGNAGKMPSGSGAGFTFSTADAARIASWIAGGAKND